MIASGGAETLTTCPQPESRPKRRIAERNRYRLTSEELKPRSTGFGFGPPLLMCAARYDHLPGAQKLLRYGQNLIGFEAEFLLQLLQRRRSPKSTHASQSENWCTTADLSAMELLMQLKC